MTEQDDLDVAGFNVEFQRPEQDLLDDGFNEYGVRENYDGDELESIDVIYNAMEPGIRKGVEITPEFLRTVEGNTPDNVPIQYDHSHSQRMNVGYLKKIKYSDSAGMLRKMFNIPNTGSQIREDTIADFTHSTGPQIKDGSVGFDPRSLEFSEPNSDEAKAQFTDGKIIEFSLTPFPAGYDNGGITPKFSQAVESFADKMEEQSDGGSQIVEAESQLQYSQLK